MTKSVADEAQTPAISLRRHTDPPALWIGVVTGSIALHLLVLWLLRPSMIFGLSLQEPTEAAVPIQLVDIPPQEQSPAQPAPQTYASTNQNTVPTGLPEPSGQVNNLPTQPAPAPDNSVAFAPPPVSPRIPYSQVPQPQPSQLTTPTPTPTPTSTPTPTTPPPTSNNTGTDTPPVQNSPSTPVPQPTPTPTPTAAEPSPIPTGSASPPDSPSSPDITPGEPTPLPSTLPPSVEADQPLPESESGGRLVASWVVAPREEQQRLIKTDIPDNLAEPLGSSQNAIVFDQQLELPPGDFQAVLVIDNNGNFVEARVNNPPVPAEQEKYVQVATQIFQNQKFQPAHSTDGRKPELSNLVVRITIDRPSSK